MATKSYSNIDKPVQLVEIVSDAGGGVAGSGNKASTYTPLSYQQLTSANIASSTALTVPTGASTAIIQNNGNQPARYRLDGATTAPTASVGMRIAATDVVTLDVGNAALTSARFIREADGAILDITYFS